MNQKMTTSTLLAVLDEIRQHRSQGRRPRAIIADRGAIKRLAGDALRANDPRIGHVDHIARLGGHAIRPAPDIGLRLDRVPVLQLRPPLGAHLGPNLIIIAWEPADQPEQPLDDLVMSWLQRSGVIN